MINIKTYAVPKDNANTSSTISTNVANTTSLADNWFYYNSDFDAICCRYNFYSVGSVSANGVGDIDEDKVEVVDNLNSTESDAALSANQGRVLKELIDNLQLYIDQNFVRRT